MFSQSHFEQLKKSENWRKVKSTMKVRIFERIMTLLENDESIDTVTTDVSEAPKPSNVAPHIVACPIPMPQQNRYVEVEVETPKGKRMMKFCQPSPQVRHNLMSNQEIQLAEQRAGQIMKK